MNDEKNESRDFEEGKDEDGGELAPVEPLDLGEEVELADPDPIGSEAVESASSFVALSSGAFESPLEDSLTPDVEERIEPEGDTISAPLSEEVGEEAQETVPSLSEQELRDADSFVLLGGFLGVLAIPVLIGTFFVGEGQRHAMIVNVVSGLVLLAIGVGLFLRGRHLLGGRLRERFSRRS